jgi:endonuclease-8
VPESIRSRFAGPQHAVSALRTALVGRAVLRFDADRVDGPAPAPGRVVEHVDCRRRLVDVAWDDGFVLHSRLGFGGAWHVYRDGEPWRRSSAKACVAITVPGWVAVCFAPAEVETFRELDVQRHPAFGRCAPDVVATHADLGLCLDQLLGYPDGDAPVGEVLLDPHVASGIGNVFRSEALYVCGLHPWAAVGELTDQECARLVDVAAMMVRTNVEAASGLAPADTRETLLVYGRNGQRCTRCGDTVRVDRSGPRDRLVYWCPGCQTAHDPQRAAAARPPLDPSPAAAQFAAELPWRRAAG